MWERAAQISHEPAPGLPQVLAHGDFHPGNVLWQRGTVSGVVDAAERFTAMWRQASGDTYHPWADVVTIIGFLDNLRDDLGSDRLLIEHMLARAVAEPGQTSR